MTCKVIYIVNYLFNVIEFRITSRIWSIYFRRILYKSNVPHYTIGYDTYIIDDTIDVYSITSLFLDEPFKFINNV